MEPQKSDEKEIAGFNNIDSFVQTTLLKVMQAVKESNGLPNADNFDYFSSFNSFRELMNLEKGVILQMMQDIMRYHGVKGRINGESEVEDKFDTLVDANDAFVERIGTLLDDAQGIKKDAAPLVSVSVKTPARLKPQISGTWNRKKKSSTSPRGGRYSLLTSRTIERPQAKFARKVDNSDSPFRPIIREKPNAILPLKDSLTVDSVSFSSPDPTLDPSFSYPHPYQPELDSFEPRSEMLTQVVPQEPGDVESTPLVFINSEDSLSALVQVLKSQPAFAVDLEHHSYRSFQGITCLMQVSSRSTDYIIDTLLLRDHLHRLNEVFTDSSIVKVFHGAYMDIEWLQRDFGLYVVNLFDTGQASIVLNLERHSFAYLLKLYCNRVANKEYQLADWRIRPLPEELITYAREDTHYLLYIYDIMRNELISRGNEQNNLLASVIQRSTKICSKVYVKPRLTEESHLELYKKSRKVFNIQQLSALQGLYRWRDRIARDLDESTGYVLPNHMLLQISMALPREPTGIMACCNPVPPLVKQNLNEIHRVITAAKEVHPIKEFDEECSFPDKGDFHAEMARHALNCPHDSPSDLDPQKNRQDPISSKFNKLNILNSDGSVNTSVSESLINISMLKRLADAEALTSKYSPLITNSCAEKASQIHKSFRSLFTRYIPSDLIKMPSSVQQSASVISMESSFNEDPVEGQAKWKLKPSSQPEKSKTEQAESTHLEKPAPPIIEPENVQIVPLRYQAHKSKRSAQLDESSEVPSMIKHIKQKMEEKEKKKEEVIAAMQLKRKEVVAHTYSKEDLSMFQGKSGGRGKRYFDPEEGRSKDFGEKKMKKHKRFNKSRNKSTTFKPQDNKSK